MNKLLTILFSLIICGYCLAEESDNNKSERKDFIFGFDTGILGIGISYGTENTFSFDLNANLADFYIENVPTSIGIEFFPINYSFSINKREHTLSFSKLYLYWNLDGFLKLNIDSGNSYGTKLILGPFFSIQTFNIINFGNFNTNISYSAGIKLARKEYGGRKTRITYISSNIELGYNYLNNRHSIYFTIGLSPATTFMIFPFGYTLLAIHGFGD